ncbi:MAG: FKBP-type peptidyl-prolyl cis-trans isomerase [Thermoplasmatota archaeon]
MRRTLALLLALLALAAPLAGCLGNSAAARVVAYDATNRAEPGRATEFALFVKSENAFRSAFNVGVEGLPSDWRFESENESLTLDGGEATSLIVRVTPANTSAYGPVPLTVHVGDGSASVLVDVKPLGTEPARPGVGVQVRTAGWWDNGTLFYWNMRELTNASGIAAHDLDDPNAPGEMEALKVYVGGQRGTHPPEPYNSSGYVPVIKGFDARLDGMLAGETRAVRIPKELAYTYPGNEKNALYGANLNFIIEVVSVDILPPSKQPTCVATPEGPLCPPGGAAIG